MLKDNYKTKVIFRKFKDNAIIALFPEDASRINYTIGDYMHVGQHGQCNYNFIVKQTKLATEAEYKDLFNELESIGYNLNIRKKTKLIYK